MQVSSSGPMFSGKTTALLSSFKSTRHMFDKSMIAKWSKDNRSGSSSSVSTHDGVSFSDGVASFDSLDRVELFPHSRALVAVDEAQFFGDDLLRLWDRIVSRDVDDMLLVAGLDLDYRRETFGRLLHLVDRANKLHPNRVEVMHLQAKCYVCNEPANYTVRTCPADEQILVGGDNMYASSCAQHHSIPIAHPIGVKL
mmetsp:Transcript_4466/g.7639  ORF Transcript_4466/g.7639 Transcript_4466/m.7639 type:complete len:197 (-) Transcript_4466:3036-3626(-)